VDELGLCKASSGGLHAAFYGQCVYERFSGRLHPGLSKGKYRADVYIILQTEKT